MSRVLITGGVGFIGTQVARELLSEGHDVVLLDSYAQYISPFECHYKQAITDRLEGIREKLVIERCDARDKLDLIRSIQKYSPQRIIHLAALPLADLSNRYPDETVSTVVGTTVNILDIVKDLPGFERFVYVSSSMIYGDFHYLPADEEHSKNPKDVYGGTKLAAEVLTRSYGNRFSIPYTIVRPSAVYGPTDVNQRVSQKFLMSAFKGEPLVLHNGGEDKLDFTYITDIAHGICLATFEPKAESETFNITRGQGRSLREYADILKSYFPLLTVEELEVQNFRPKRGALDISKAQKILGYEPQVSLEDGIRKYVEYVLANYPGGGEPVMMPIFAKKRAPRLRAPKFKTTADVATPPAGADPLSMAEQIQENPIR